MNEAYLQYLHGFRFATEGDKEMARTVVSWIEKAEAADLRRESFRPPLVVISGPPGCGESTLAARLADEALDCDRLALLPNVPNGSLDFGWVASERYPVVSLCDFHEVTPEVEKWVNASEWEFRRLHHLEAREVCRG